MRCALAPGPSAGRPAAAAGRTAPRWAERGARARWTEVAAGRLLDRIGARGPVESMSACGNSLKRSARYLKLVRADLAGAEELRERVHVAAGSATGLTRRSALRELGVRLRLRIGLLL